MECKKPLSTELGKSYGDISMLGLRHRWSIGPSFKFQIQDKVPELRVTSQAKSMDRFICVGNGWLVMGIYFDKAGLLARRRRQIYICHQRNRHRYRCRSADQVFLGKQKDLT